MLYRLIFLLLPLLCGEALAQEQSQLNIESLSGISDIVVVVEEPDPQGRIEGLSRDEIKTEVELRLRRNGIGVLDWTGSSSNLSSSWIEDGGPHLHVIINTKGPDDGLLTFSMDIALKQDVYLERNDQLVNDVSTWEVGALGTVGINHVNDIISAVGSYVDIFCNDYLSVNPRR